MPLFKNLKLAVKGKKQDFRINIRENGIFWCQSQLWGGATLEAESFSGIELLVYEAINKYNKAATKEEYFIQYRLNLSRRLKSNFTALESVGEISEELWQKTRGVGSEYFTQEAVGFVIEWHPLVKITCGSSFQMHRLKPAEQSDLDYVAAYGDLFTDDLHYPFGKKEAPFIVTSTFHSFQGGEQYFELPLTPETFAFFQNTELNLTEVIGKFLLFISQDPQKLLLTITNLELTGGKEKLLSGEIPGQPVID